MGKEQSSSRGAGTKRPDRPIQPARDPQETHPSVDDELQHEHELAAEALITDTEDEDAKAVLQRLRRLEGDQRLRDHLASQGFQGPEYQLFEEELVRYAYAVLSAWLLTGAVFLQLRRLLKIKLNMTDTERDILRGDRDARQELAGLVIAKALPVFRQKALVEGGWTSTGQARLTTYFMGRVLWAFPNEFRQWAGDLRRNELARPSIDEPVFEDIDGRHPSPESLAVASMQASDSLKDLNILTRQIYVLHDFGYSHAEIAELCNLQSERSVEGHLYRWRTMEKKRRSR